MVGRSFAGLEDRVTRVDRRVGAPVDLAKDPSDSDPAEDGGEGGSRESTGSPRAVQQLSTENTGVRLHARTRTHASCVCITPAR